MASPAFLHSYFRKKFKEEIASVEGVRVLTPHSCRHTYVSQMQALGVDLATIQSLVGHADVDMTKHYLHVQDPVRQNAIAKFEDAFFEKTQEVQYISSTYASKMTKGPAPSNGIKIAIVGSGPAGITIAILMARQGYQVTIFESKDKIGGILRYGIPEFRLPKSVLDDIQYRHLEMKGIKIRPNTRIGGAIGVEELFRDGYKAIFIGTGVWKANTLGIKGETFGNVHYAINYLNNPDVYKLGEKVIVIGAGNAAMDVARTAMRQGTREVTCFSLSRTIAASQYEFSYAQLEGVEFTYNKKPVEIVDDGVIFRDLVENEDGSFVEIEGSDRLYPADSIIISISQGPQNTIVSTTTGLNTNARGLLTVDEAGRTSRPGIFASGDVVNGARTVVEAVSYSKHVAEAMHEYIQNTLDSEK